MNALLNIPLADWSNGLIMIGVFVLVVVILIGVAVSIMTRGGKKGKEH